MASDRTVIRPGFKLTIASGSVTKKVQAAITEGLLKVARNYKTQIIKNISLDEHTLDELRELGFPYSKKHPESSLHDDRMVHEQTGRLKAGISEGKVEQTSSRRWSIFITSNAPYTPYLIFGTSKMRPRRFHEKAYEEIKDKFWDPVIAELGKVQHRITMSPK
jgi:HK97 gp10 family phage protein